MEMTATLFIDIWKKYLKLIDPDFQKYWDSNTHWTNYILNSKAPKKNNLLNNILIEFKFKRIEFEYRKIDVTIFSNEEFKEINNYDNSGFIKDHFPVCIEAIIEHENNYKTCFEEIRKLTEIKARLKVLITYPQDKDSAVAIIQKMGKGIKQSNSRLNENEMTEYLLILGFNINDWNYIVFNTEGEKKT